MPITDETRTQIFDILKRNLEAYSPPMVAKSNPEEFAYELSGNKAVPYGHDKKMVPGMYFVSVASRKDSLVFYFFPCYYNESMLALAPELSKCLKGKTCFHFKKVEQVNEDELQALLKAGLEAWIKAGYMQ